MFERFTDRARKAVVLAQEEARMLRHREVDTGHLLLGLASENCGGVAQQALTALGATADAVRDALAKLSPPGHCDVPGHIPFTPKLKRAMEDALREALSLGCNYIGTEHLLLGLVRPDDGQAREVIDALGLTGQDVREAVLELLGSYEQEPGTPPPAAIARPAAPSFADPARTITSLDAHIERRAREIAQPVIDAAEADAQRRVMTARTAAQRWQDCNAELARVLAVRDRQLEQARAALERVVPVEVPDVT